MSVRASGILLHFSSLPSVGGIGDIGPAAHAFVRLLASAGQSCWQFLPLNPTSTFIGNSPYSSPSAFACNPLFISLERLADEGLVSWADIGDLPGGVSEGGALSRVDYEAVDSHRRRVLRAAYERNRGALAVDGGFRDFCRAEAHWLDDYAAFVSIKSAHSGASWDEWPEKLCRRDPAALGHWAASESVEMDYVRFEQYLFHRQWRELRAVAANAGVRLIGDVPIYVTYDSADVWAAPHFFKLGEDLRPVTVAGVPPDYFSETGQRWGNPVYDWDALRADGYRWWVRRLRRNLALADMVRIDHFRGFAGFWEIPAEEATAINGRWVSAPGMELFSVLSRALPGLPFIAEDLGVITPDVRELRDTFALPGMKMLQFAFGGDPASNPDIPFRHVERSVVYTGTHDNPPTRAWFDALPDGDRWRFETYVGHEVGSDRAATVMQRLALGSVAGLCLLPLQDVLGLGGEARMNMPSIPQGNWSWRMLPEHMELRRYEALARMTALYGRC